MRRLAPKSLNNASVARHVAPLDKRDRLSLLESSQAAAVGTGDLAGPGVRYVAPGGRLVQLPCPFSLGVQPAWEGAISIIRGR